MRDFVQKEPYQSPIFEYFPSKHLLYYVPAFHTTKIPYHNCMELKGYIARCKFFVGARTHATIAAYSSCVPTLVLGYSVKSRGIANDLFQTNEHYVLPVQSLSDPLELARNFDWIMDHEQEIKTHLKNIIPDYISKAYLGKKYVEKLG